MTIDEAIEILRSRQGDWRQAVDFAIKALIAIKAYRMGEDSGKALLDLLPGEER